MSSEKEAKEKNIYLDEEEQWRLSEFLDDQAEKAELEDLYWIEGEDECYMYCFECAAKEVERLKADQPEADIFVDGGFGIEEDGTQSCEKCGKPLDCSFTNYGSEFEVDYFIENGFDHKDAYECHVLRTAISCRGWEPWSERIYMSEVEKNADFEYFRKLHVLCRKVLAKINDG